jgi:hypothetical protein
MDLPVRVVCDTAGSQVLRRRPKFQLILDFSFPWRGVAQPTFSPFNHTARINSLGRFIHSIRPRRFSLCYQLAFCLLPSCLYFGQMLTAAPEQFVSPDLPGQWSMILMGQGSPLGVRTLGMEHSRKLNLAACWELV